MQTRFLTLSALCLAVLSLLCHYCSEAESMTVVTDKPDAIYQVNETAYFLVVLPDGFVSDSTATLTYVLSNDGLELARGILSLASEPLSVSGTMKAPGFLRCTVTLPLEGQKPMTAAAAAAFDPLEIKPTLPAPDDFDAFWDERKALLAAVPMNPQLTRLDSSTESIECFDLTLDCLGERPVSGYFAKPANAAPKSLPAMLWVHGAGVRGGILSSAIQGAEWEMLSLDINAHGIPNGKDEDFYTNLAQTELKDYTHRGKESRETSYFLFMFLRLVRAMDFLMAQPEWDGEIFIVRGSSQGGAQALAAAGLNPRVTAMACSVPGLCDNAGLINGWPRLVPRDSDGSPDEAILQASRYVDVVNFAARANAEAIFSVGFIDNTCRPTTVYAAYNSYKGPKRIINKPLMPHAIPKDIQEAFAEMILDHVAKMKRSREHTED